MSKDPHLGLKFKKAVGFAPHHSFSPSEEHGQGQQGLPDWSRVDPSWDIDREPLGYPAALMYEPPNAWL